MEDIPLAKTQRREDISVFKVVMQFSMATWRPGGFARKEGRFV
jgi:hypothetical protein